MAAKKKKRKLTAKQIAAGFGGKKKSASAGEMGWGGFKGMGTAAAGKKKGRKKGKRKAKRGGHVPLPILKRRLARLSSIVKSRS